MKPITFIYNGETNKLTNKTKFKPNKKGRKLSFKQTNKQKPEKTKLHVRHTRNYFRDLGSYILS